MLSVRLGSALEPLTLKRGARAPHLAEIKDYLRFVAKVSRGRLDKGKKVTVDSLVVNAEWFFAGFARVTGVEVDIGDRQSVYRVRESHINTSVDYTANTGLFLVDKRYHAQRRGDREQA